MKWLLLLVLVGLAACDFVEDVSDMEEEYDEATELAVMNLADDDVDDPRRRPPPSRGPRPSGKPRPPFLGKCGAALRNCSRDADTKADKLKCAKAFIVCIKSHCPTRRPRKSDEAEDDAVDIDEAAELAVIHISDDDMDDHRRPSRRPRPSGRPSKRPRPSGRPSRRPRPSGRPSRRHVAKCFLGFVHCICHNITAKVCVPGLKRCLRPRHPSEDAELAVVDISDDDNDDMDDQRRPSRGPRPSGRPSRRPRPSGRPSRRPRPPVPPFVAKCGAALRNCSRDADTKADKLKCGKAFIVCIKSHCPTRRPRKSDEAEDDEVDIDEVAELAVIHISDDDMDDNRRPSRRPRPSGRPSRRPRPSGRPSRRPRPSGRPSRRPRPPMPPHVAKCFLGFIHCICHNKSAKICAPGLKRCLHSRRPSEDAELAVMDISDDDDDDMDDQRRPSRGPRPSGRPSRRPRPSGRPSRRPRPSGRPSRRPRPPVRPFVAKCIAALKNCGKNASSAAEKMKCGKAFGVCLHLNCSRRRSGNPDDEVNDPKRREHKCVGRLRGCLCVLRKPRVCLHRMAMCVRRHRRRPRPSGRPSGRPSRRPRPSGRPSGRPSRRPAVNAA